MANSELFNTKKTEVMIFSNDKKVRSIITVNDDDIK